MAETFDVTYTVGTWSLAAGGLVFEAAHPVHDRGVIRVLLTVLNNGALVYRDRVNLSSQHGRHRVLKTLRQSAEVEIPETALLALDEAIRRTPRTKAENAQRDTPPDTAEKVPQSLDLARVHDLFCDFLELEDIEAVDVMLGVAQAHKYPGDPPWLFVVGPSSGAKTELVLSLERTPGVFLLSELTARTFASGLTAGGEDPSLLARLTNEILLLKDFTTVLEMHREERGAILAQLREIYDGRYDKVWGTGKELHWRGRLGFVAGVTPVIDTHHSTMAILGPRFLMLRFRQPDRHKAAQRAMANADRAHDARENLARAVATFLTGLPKEPPEVPEEQQETLARLADYVTRARSGVERDRYRRELDYAPEPEMPARFAKQLFSLARGLAVVRGRNEVTEDDIRTVVRVGLDCIPAVRRLALEHLAAGDEEDLTTSALAQQAQYSTTTIRRALEDLQALGLVECEKGGQGRADRWRLRDEWRGAVRDFAEEAGKPRRGLYEDHLSRNVGEGVTPTTPGWVDEDY